MRLLVTGGAGFIGSNFTRYILERYPGYRITVLDKLTYCGNLENLAGLASEPRFRFVQGDICDSAAVDALLKEGADAVVHFAAESHVDRSILDASEFARTNVVGTLCLLDASRRQRVGRFVQISTDEVYGSLGREGSFTEQSPLAPNSPYAATKASADLLVRSYHRTHGFAAVITRCSNNYGPYQFPEKLIPLLITNATSGIALPIYGDGMNVRDWIYVEDHCAAIDMVLHHGKDGEVYNIGARQEKPNLEIARTILGALGKGEDLLTFVEDRPGHDRRYAIDPARIERELGWSPKFDFETGIRHTIDWYRRNSGWVEGIRSGAYRSYYDRMYRDRRRTLSGIRGERR